MLLIGVVGVGVFGFWTIEAVFGHEPQCGSLVSQHEFSVRAPNFEQMVEACEQVHEQRTHTALVAGVGLTASAGLVLVGGVYSTCIRPSCSTTTSESASS